jgi:potassium inwardly-rectifying channel subfamily J
MSPQDLQNSNFELIVVLEGIVEPTGNTAQVRDNIQEVNLNCPIQSRSSYLPQEILWGYRFDNLVSYARKQVRVEMAEYSSDYPLDCRECTP